MERVQYCLSLFLITILFLLFSAVRINAQPHQLHLIALNLIVDTDGDQQSFFGAMWDGIVDGATTIYAGGSACVSWVGTAVSEFDIDAANQAFSDTYNDIQGERQEDKNETARQKGKTAALYDFGGITKAMKDVGSEGESFIKGPVGICIGIGLVVIIVIIILFLRKNKTLSSELDDGYVNGVKVVDTNMKSIDMMADEQGVDFEDIKAAKF